MRFFNHFKAYPRLALLVSAALLSACAANIPKVLATPAPTSQSKTLIGTIWVADENGNSITVIDASDNKVITTLTGIEGPHNIQVAPDDKRVWVVSGHESRVVVIDATNYSVLGSVATGKEPAHVVLTPDGKTVYVTNSTENSVTVIDAQAMKAVTTIPVGKSPHGLRPSPDGKWVYVANAGDTTLSIIDTAKNTKVADIEVGQKPVQVGFSPDGKYVYFSLNAENAVGRVDVAARKMTGKVEVGPGPVQVFVTPDNEFVLAANQGASDKPGTTVSIIDTATFTVVRSVETGRGAHGVVINPSGQTAYITNIYDNNVAVLDVVTSKVITTVTSGAGPNGISFSALPPARANATSIAIGQKQEKPKALTVTSNEGDITLSVTWKGIIDDGVVFDVVMDTHAVNLDNYDLAKMAVLRGSQGRQVMPTSWAAPPGGHHRSGTLIFPVKDSSDQPLIEEATQSVELSINNVGGVSSRRFEWTP